MDHRFFLHHDSPVFVWKIINHINLFSHDLKILFLEEKRGNVTPLNRQKTGETKRERQKKERKIKIILRGKHNGTKLCLEHGHQRAITSGNFGKVR